MAPLVVAGGSIAALVAADAAAAAGREVLLLLPEKNVGGGFAPLRLGPHRLDRGLRALELDYEGAVAPPPLVTYDAAGAGHRPFVQTVAAVVRDLAGAELTLMDPPLMWLGGKLGAEIHVTCDLTRLHEHVTGEQAAAIVREAHPSDAGLLAPAQTLALGSAPFDRASRTQHGATFHELALAPLAAKLRPEGATDVPVTLRRKLWLPLFHPSTLRAALERRPLDFVPHRPFHTLVPGGPGLLVERLVERIEASPHATVRRVGGFARIGRAPRGAVEIVPAGDGAAPVVAHRPILALGTEVLAAAGIPYAPDRVHSVLTWLSVAEDDVLELPSFVHVVDPDVDVYRLSAGERAGGRVTVCAELAHHVAKDDAGAVAVAALMRLGLVREGAAVETIAAFAGPTFTAPTFANEARFQAARAAYVALDLPAQAIGGIEAFGADSFNEQLMQGLRAAALAASAPAPAAA